MIITVSVTILLDISVFTIFFTVCIHTLNTNHIHNFNLIPLLDFCKIESRPTSVKLLQTLQLRNQNPNMTPEDAAFAKPSTNSQDLPRFR